MNIYDVKNTIILVLLVIVAMLLVDRFTADYTMSQQDANRLAKPAIVYLCGAQEDDVYIQPSDIGRVDLQHCPNN